MSEQEPLAERIGAVLDKHVGWQMHRGQMIDELCAAVSSVLDVRCGRCQGDRGWTGLHGAWEPCPDCNR